MHTAGPAHGGEHLLIKLLQQGHFLLLGLLRDLADVRLEQIEALLAFLIVVHGDVRLDLAKNEGLLNERDQLSGLDVVLVLREGLVEVGLVEQGVGGMREVALLQVFVDKDVQLVRFYNDGHL